MISVGTVTEIKNMLLEQGVDEASVNDLRNKWPDIHFTYCSEDDIHAGKPVDRADSFCLYLVNSSLHCLALTNDHAIASGLVVAECYDEDE